jgi:hypothetical protein
VITSSTWFLGFADELRRHSVIEGAALEEAMNPSTDRYRTISRRSVTALSAVAVLVGAFGVTGCAAVKKAKAVEQDVRGNRATMTAFTTQMKSSAATTFEVTYVTTGSSPATIVYAVQPPNGIAFKDTPTPGGSNTDDLNNLDVIANSSGEYACTPPATGSSADSCQMLAPVDAATENKIFDFYTPSHWVTFLNDFSLAAGFAGDKVTKSTMTVNGFAMNCVDFVATGEAGTSTICTTSQGILGYVKVAADATSFEIQSYSTSPPASLFQLPPGATVTKVTIPSASPS